MSAPVPVLSSLGSRWEGFVLEWLAHGAYSAPDREYSTHFICLHRGIPSPVIWRSLGKSGRTTAGPGALAILSRGARAAVSFPQAVERLVLKLEWWVVYRALQEQESSPRLAFVSQWGVRDL
jgi:hypothetical protein